MPSPNGSRTGSRSGTGGQTKTKPAFAPFRSETNLPLRRRGDAFAKWVADWLAKRNVDTAKYDAAFRSFSVESKLRRASQMGRAYRLDGVPTLAVQGRYLVVASTSRKAMLATADFLIGETRKQLAKAKP